MTGETPAISKVSIDLEAHLRDELAYAGRGLRSADGNLGTISGELIQ